MLAVLLALLSAAVGCDGPGATPAAWDDASASETPPLLERRHGHPALADLDGLYLGQPRTEARDALDRYCRGELLRRDGGAMGGPAYFLGCRVDDNPNLRFVRVGFWPRLDDRVATLEVKRPTVPPAAVHAALRAFMEGEPNEEVLGDRIIQVEYPDYRFFADWDQGLDGPTHLTVGFTPSITLDRLD